MQDCVGSAGLGNFGARGYCVLGALTMMMVITMMMIPLYNAKIFEAHVMLSDQ